MVWCFASVVCHINHGSFSVFGQSCYCVVSIMCCCSIMTGKAVEIDSGLLLVKTGASSALIIGGMRHSYCCAHCWTSIRQQGILFKFYNLHYIVWWYFWMISIIFRLRICQSKLIFRKDLPPWLGSERSERRDVLTRKLDIVSGKRLLKGKWYALFPFFGFLWDFNLAMIFDNVKLSLTNKWIKDDIGNINCCQHAFFDIYSTNPFISKC